MRSSSVAGYITLCFHTQLKMFILCKGKKQFGVHFTRLQSGFFLLDLYPDLAIVGL